MSSLVLRVGQTYCLHLYCENCMRPATRFLAVPKHDEAPSDVEELLESGLLADLHYSCTHCDSPLSRLRGVTLPSLHFDAA